MGATPRGHKQKAWEPQQWLQPEERRPLPRWISSAPMKESSWRPVANARRQLEMSGANPAFQIAVNASECYEPTHQIGQSTIDIPTAAFQNGWASWYIMINIICVYIYTYVCIYVYIYIQYIYCRCNNYFCIFFLLHPSIFLHHEMSQSWMADHYHVSIYIYIRYCYF